MFVNIIHHHLRGDIIQPVVNIYNVILQGIVILLIYVDGNISNKDDCGWRHTNTNHLEESRPNFEKYKIRKGFKIFTI